MWVFRQLFDPASSTYTYLLADQGQAVLIDPVFEQVRRDSALLRELGLQLRVTLDTHVHADHVTGAWLHRQASGCDIAVAAAAGTQGHTRALQPGDRIAFGRRSLLALATPGHTAGCMSFVLDDESSVFTGDALLIRGCGRTDFQQGSAQQLYRSVRQQLFGLPAGCLVYPGHDYRGLTASSIDEERRHNPRLGGDASESDFAGYMAHLGLAHPKLIDVAVPANLRCGALADGPLPPDWLAPRWAPLNFTFSGLWEIEPDVLQELLQEQPGQVQVLDVREAAEFGDALGHLPAARSLPLAELARRTGELDPARPVVAVCRSGARSAQAAVLLTRAGFTQVANLAGGMLRWRGRGLPVAGDDGAA